MENAGKISFDPTKKNLTITYKTSLGNLKEIGNQIHSGKNLNISIKIPSIFFKPKFHSSMSKEELYDTGIEIFSTLGIPHNRNLPKGRQHL